MTLVLITHYTSPNYTDRPKVNIHCIENFFLRLPWKNKVAQKIFTVVNILFIFRIFNNLCLPWKEFPLKISLYWIYFLSFSIFEQLRLLGKTELPRNFSLYWIYILHLGVLSNLRLPWKTAGRLNSQYWIYIFYHSAFSSNLRLPWKTEFALEFFTVLNMYFLSFRIFEQLALALKNSCPEFTVLKYASAFRIFEQLALTLKNGVVLKIFGVLNILFTFKIFWASCACPEKQSCPGIFHCIEICFIIQDFWATSACPENRVCPEIFQTRGGGRLPPEKCS